MPDFNPEAYGTPNRGTSEASLDQWNRAMRASPVYQSFMRARGLSTDGRVRLSRQQQGELERALRSAGFNIPSGMHIDQGGNLNQRNRLVRNSLIGAGVAAGGLGALGAAGVGPLSGLAGGGGAGASGAAGAAGTGAGAGSLAPIAGGAPWAVTPYATTATMAGTGAGAGAGIGAGVAAGAAGSGVSGYRPGWEGNSDILNIGSNGRGMFSGMDLQDWLALAMSGAGTIGGALSNPPNLNPNTTTTDPNLQRLLQMMQGRLEKSEPLYDSIMAMANGLLPTQYQRGGGGMR